MGQKVIIKPGTYIVLALLVFVGIFFGIQYLNKSGKMSKIAATVAPSNKTTASGVTVTPIKLGGKKPLIVAVNTWVGFAPGVYFNEGFEPTENSRFYKEFGVVVQFVKMENFDDSRNAWKNDQVDVICNTADVLSIEMPGLISFEPKVFIQIDWSRGGDKIVVRPGINCVADLKGKKIALAIGSPSQSLIINVIESGGVTWNDIKDGIITMTTALQAAEAFKSGNADAAIVWAPDDEDCIKAFPGSKVLISTEKARNAISDVFYTKQSIIKDRRQDIQSFVAGWLKASAELNTSAEARTKAQKIMSAAFQASESVMNLSYARFTTYGDNVNFFGLSALNCNCVKGEDLYSRMARAFNNIGLISGNVPAWRDITDITILQSLNGSFSGPANDAEQDITFTKPTKQLEKATAIATKRITINFATGSAILNDEAKYIIDKEIAPIARTMSGYRIRIEGNTDNVGSDQTNIPLSKNRAIAVKNYLSQQYGFDVNRFIVIGNGSTNPIAENDTEEGKAANRRTDFELVKE
jgi:NitT/TauT family transport system substrate-binding protein